MRELTVASLEGYIPGANVNRFGDIYKRLSVTSLAATDNHAHIKQVGDDLFADTSETELLDRHGKLHGLPRKLAVGASASSALRVFGDSGATVPVSEPMTHIASGQTFETSSGGLIPAAGFLDVNVSAISTGETTNLEENQELTFDVTPVDLLDTATLQIDLENGLDKELDGPYRARLLIRIAQGAAGGNRLDWESFVVESAANIATGYAYPNRNGLGTVDVAGLKTGSGTIRTLSVGERATLLGDVDALRPVSAVARVLETTTLGVDVETTVIRESDAQFAFDWDDSTAPLVLTYVSATRLLTFAAARPANMEAGDRLVVKSTGASGKEFTIESLSGSDAVVLTVDLDFTPTATDPVYSGGPVVQTTRQSIIDLFDALGPANPDTKNYGPWEGNLRLATLFEAIQTTEGILDSTLITPVANVVADDPAFPANTSVELLIPGRIIVRKQ